MQNKTIKLIHRLFSNFSTQPKKNNEMKKKTITRLFFLLSLVLSSLLHSQEKSFFPNTSIRFQAGKSAAEEITRNELELLLKFISSDELQGRKTPSVGLNIAANFIAFNLAEMGVKPGAGNGSFFQKVSLNRKKVGSGETKIQMIDQNFSFDNDFLLKNLLSSKVDAPMVYVGHGWFSREKDIDPYKSLDIKGKIVIVSGGGFPPKEFGLNFPPPGKQGEDWDHPFSYAQQHGAKGVIVLPGMPELGRWKESVAGQIEGTTLPVKNLEPLRIVYEHPFNPKVTVGMPIKEEGSIPMVVVSLPMANSLFEGEKVGASEIIQRVSNGVLIEGFDLDPKKILKIRTKIINQLETAYNVVGIIEGSDPALKDEYVGISAHYDHLGTGGGLDDSIFNGADDNGTGTVALIEMAESFLKSKKQLSRSIILMWFAGEENGLLGSKSFVQAPTIPLENLIVLLNIDMIGRNRELPNQTEDKNSLHSSNEIFLIGPQIMSKDLEEMTRQVNKKYLKLDFNHEYDDVNHPDRYFFRSDHVNFAKKDIPIVFFFDGGHKDYHKPSDSYEKIDYKKFEKVSRTIFLTAWELANIKEKPKVDTLYNNL